jgi:phosphoribosylaminoimidazole-succinocarboxamide synthase
MSDLSQPPIAELPEPLHELAKSNGALYQGKSKHVWEMGDGLCLVGLVPSLSSFTFNREAHFAQTGPLRLDFYELAAATLEQAGVGTVLVERVSPSFYVAKHCPGQPFEVIVKNFAVGSTLRKYPGLFKEREPFSRGIVKFDYRCDPEDQPIGEDYLRYLGVPVDEWRSVADATNRALQDWLAPRLLVDFCIILGVDSDGTSRISSEVSPDCMRLVDENGESLDKDLFRQGVSEESIVEVWSQLVASLR